MLCNSDCPNVEIALRNQGKWCVSRLSPIQLRQKHFEPDSVVFIRVVLLKGIKFDVAIFVGLILNAPFSYQRCGGILGVVERTATLVRRRKLTKPENAKHIVMVFYPCKLASANNFTYTWFRFIIKRFLPKDNLEGGKDYVWYKFNVFTNWVAQTKTTYVLVFDPRPEVRELIEGSFHTTENANRNASTEKSDIKLVEINKGEFLRRRPNEHNEPKKKHSSPLMVSSEVSEMCKGLRPTRLLDRIANQSLINPYAIHALFLEDVVFQLEESIWGIRDRLRAVELQRTSKEHPNPDYESVHDVARHAIHVSETMDAAISTIISIKAEHDQFRKTQDPANRKELIEGNRVRRCLDFSESMLRNLRFRSSSNMTRLQNEIQLAFNIVSQQIGRSAKADSNAMLGIALLTMLFLPPTFMSSIFSMSFFNFDSEHDRWVWSSKFWLYWAFTLPITLISLLLFLGYYIFNHPAKAGSLKKAEEKKTKPRRLPLQWRARENSSQSSPA